MTNDESWKWTVISRSLDTIWKINKLSREHCSRIAKLDLSLFITKTLGFPKFRTTEKLPKKDVKIWVPIGNLSYLWDWPGHFTSFYLNIDACFISKNRTYILEYFCSWPISIPKSSFYCNTPVKRCYIYL